MKKNSTILLIVAFAAFTTLAIPSAVLGVALLNVQHEHGLVQSALYGFGAAVGFSLVLVLFAAVRERVAMADVPEPFQGNAIALITAGVISLSFYAFRGMV